VIWSFGTFSLGADWYPAVFNRRPHAAQSIESGTFLSIEHILDRIHDHYLPASGVVSAAVMEHLNSRAGSVVSRDIECDSTRLLWHVLSIAPAGSGVKRRMRLRESARRGY
jgi:hypothetical protein